MGPESGVPKAAWLGVAVVALVALGVWAASATASLRWEGEGTDDAPPGTATAGVPADSTPDEASTGPTIPPSDSVWFRLDLEAVESVAEVWEMPGVDPFGQLEHTLTTGLTDTEWGGTKALRMNFRSARSSVDQSVGFTITPPDRAERRVREVWIEVWARYSSNWTTEGPEIPEGMDSYSSSHKFMLLFDQTHASGWRWEDMQGVGGTSTFHQVMIAGGDLHGPATSIGNDWMSVEYDGDWHRYRYHARMDEESGRFMLDLDGSRRIGFEGIDTSEGPDRYFNVFEFGANNNRGTPEGQDMWYEVAGLTLHVVDPGWGF